MPPKLTKVCPYCGKTCKGYYPNNLICECGAKYYAETDTWLERKNKKENPDLVEVVRCKDCKHCDHCYPMKNKGEEAKEGYYCDYNKRYVKPNDYCSYGERSENGT